MPDSRWKALLGSLLFSLVPLAVAVLIPWGWFRPALAWPGGARGPAGLLLALAGSLLYAACAFDFSWRGRGTPLPLAAPRALVRNRLYARLRNPMYWGVLLTVLGQGLAFADLRYLFYAAGLWLAFHGFVVFHEEPALRRKFGPEYEAYLARVPRWLPRISSRPRRPMAP